MAEQQSFLIWPGGADPGMSYGSLEMRRRIAQALSARNRGFPKTKGEGLTYLGESIGEGLQYLGLQRAEAERQKNIEKMAGKVVDAKSSEPTTTSTKTSYDQTDNKPFPAAASDDAYNKDRPTQTVQAPADTGPAVAYSDIAPMQTTAAWPEGDVASTFNDRFAAASAPQADATPVQTVPVSPPAASFSDRYSVVDERPLQSLPTMPSAALPSETINSFTAQQTQAPAQAPVAAPSEPAAQTPEQPQQQAAQFNQRRIASIDANSTVKDAIERAAAKYGIDPSLMKTIAHIESSGVPGAASNTGSYRGLFQLSNGEFVRAGGTGNIYDPHANADAAGRILAENVANFRSQNGRDPTPTELYMMHQQGPGGTAAHMSNPDRPAWQAMLSTGEGQQKGEGWAKRAIWGNIPDDLKGRFGNVNNVTSRDLFNIYEAKINGGGDVGPVNVAVAGGSAGGGVAGGGGGGAGSTQRVGDPRDAIVEALLTQQQPQPQQQAQEQPTQEEAAAESRLADVTGARRPGSPIFAPTASLGRAGVATDAPMPGLSPMGSLGGGVDQSVEARRNAISDALQNQQPTAPVVPQENPTQPGTSTSPTTASPWTSAATSALPNPPIISDIRPAPVGGPGAQLAQAAPAVAPAAVPAPTPQSNLPSPYGGITPYKADPEPTPPKRMGRDPQELEAIKMKLMHPGDPDVAQIADTILRDKEQQRNDAFQRDIEKYKSDLIRYNASKAKADEDAAGGYVKRLQDYAAAQQKLPTTVTGAPGIGAPGTPGAVSVNTPQEPDPRLGTPQSPQRDGIPPVPSRPPEIPPAEWATHQVKLRADAIEAVQKAIPQFENSIRTIQLARNHPGLYAGTGLSGEYARKIRGTEAYAFNTVNEQMKGQEFLGAYAALKGGGNIATVEGEKATAAMARIDPGQDPKNYIAALNDAEYQLRRDMELAQRKVHMPVTAWQQTPNDPVAPDIGQRRVNKEGGYVEEYIGGNPADKQRSWKRVQ